MSVTWTWAGRNRQEATLSIDGVTTETSRAEILDAVNRALDARDKQPWMVGPFVHPGQTRIPTTA